MILKPKTLPALTGLRGIAALWVTLFHLSPTVLYLLNKTSTRASPLVRDGYLGVDLFFILSGFILFHVYSGHFTRYTGREHLQFLWIRLARIYPLHIFSLMLVAVTVVLLPDFQSRYDVEQFTGKNFSCQLLLVNNWGGICSPDSWNVPAWSLSAEWFAYLLFPAALLCARKLDSRLVCAGGAIVFLSAVLIIASAAGHPDLNAAGKAGMVRMAGEFMAGVLLCRVYQLYDGQPPHVPIAAAMGLTIAASAIWRAEQFLVFFFAALILFLARSKGVASRIFGSAAVVFLGEISFSIYLLHWIIIQVLNWNLVRLGSPHSVLQWACFATAVVSLPAASWLTWKFVEIPSRNAARRMAGEPRQKTQQAIAASSLGR